MIKIENIIPYGAGIPIGLKSLEKEFFEIANQGKSPYDRLLKVYISNKTGKTKLNTLQSEFIYNLLEEYETILLSPPQKLARLITKYSKYNRLLYTDKTTIFGKAILDAFNYKDGFRSEENKGIWLAKKLNIKTCPYCNCQYTLYVKQKDNSGLAKFQFDHFFSKDRYPYLSVSLYNLIPSCASCNLKKSNKLMNLKEHFHPYYNSLHEKAKFKVKYSADITKLNIAGISKMKENDIIIEFVPRRKSYAKVVKAHDDIFDINPIYERHKDIAHEILMKAVLNNKYYQKGTGAISGLFPDKATMLKYILGNYLKENEINKRPLSKLYQDLAKQLKLI